MLAIEDCALVLLAAGRSLRFEGGDKLAAPFLDKPLGYHVVAALEGLKFKARIAVVSETQLDYASRGFQVVRNPDPAAGQAGSLCLGVKLAEQLGARSMLVVLADMPWVTATHVCQLFITADGEAAIVASSDGSHPRPPALFGAQHFDELLKLEGDIGARDLIRKERHVITSAAELVDVDTQEDLVRLRELWPASPAVSSLTE